MRIRYWKGMRTGAVGPILTRWLFGLAQFSKWVAHVARAPLIDPSRSRSDEVRDGKVASPIGFRFDEQLCADDCHG